jgi:hypothetical protein
MLITLHRHLELQRVQRLLSEGRALIAWAPTFRVLNYGHG